MLTAPHSPVATLGEPDLVRRVCAALDVAEQAVGAITPGPEGAPKLVTLANLSEKVVAETAMLLLCAATVQDRDDGIRQRVAVVAGLIQPLARSDTVLAGICLEPGLARDHALAHTILDLLGWPDTDTEALLSKSLTMSSDLGPERLPHRMLEQEWLARITRAGPRTMAPDPDLPSRSALGRPLDALFSTTDDVYAFTHAVMYLSDLGQRQVTLPRPPEAIASDADAALAFSLDRDDFDLTAEVLLSWPMLGLPWSSSASFAFVVLASAEDELGFLPGPTFDRAHYESLPGDDRMTYALVSSYHTDFIWGFLCASALRPGCAPPPWPATTAPTSGAGRYFLALDADDHRPRWRRAAAELPSAVQDAIAPLVVASLLRRSAEVGKLRMIQRVLQHALSNDLVDGPAPLQAAALLQRSALLDGVMQRRTAPPQRS